MVESQNQWFSARLEFGGWGISSQGTFVICEDFLLVITGEGYYWHLMGHLMGTVLCMFHIHRTVPQDKYLFNPNVSGDEVEKHCYKLMSQNIYMF